MIQISYYTVPKDYEADTGLCHRRIFCDEGVFVATHVTFWDWI